MVELPFALLAKCRLCLSNSGKLNISDNFDLKQDLYKYLFIKVSISDNLPQSICEDCYKKLNDFINLKDLAKISDIRLKLLLYKEKVNYKQNDKENLLKIKIKRIGNHYCSTFSTEPQIKQEISKNDEMRLRDIVARACFGTVTEDISCSTTASWITERKNEVEGEPLSTTVRDDDISCSTNASCITEHRNEEEGEPLSTTVRDVKPEAISNESIREQAMDDISCSTNASCITEHRNEEEGEPLSTTVRDKVQCKNEDVKTSDYKVKTQIQMEYVCDICSKKYNTRKKMYHHIRTHNKRYVCPKRKCRKRFACKNDLTKHIRVHTGSKPYHCELCGVRFAQMIGLRSHFRAMHSSQDDDMMIK